jgi:hypothetical protein
MTVLLVGMYFVRVGPSFGNNPRHVLEDAPEAFYQVRGGRRRGPRSPTDLKPFRRLVRKEPRGADPVCALGGLERPQSVRRLERHQAQFRHDERGRGLRPVAGGVGPQRLDRVADVPLAPAGESPDLGLPAQPFLRSLSSSGSSSSRSGCARSTGSARPRRRGSARDSFARLEETTPTQREWRRPREMWGNFIG